MSCTLGPSGVVVVPSLLSPEWAQTLFDLLVLRSWRNEAKRDNQVPDADSFWGDATLDALLINLSPQIEKLSGKRLLPTYAYARLYTYGNALPRHRDRAEAQLAVTIHLGHDGLPPPPINFAPDLRLIQQPGDAAIYLGDAIEHWRDAYVGQRFGQLFLNYVFANGDRASRLFDGRLDAFPPQICGRYMQ